MQVVLQLFFAFLRIKELPSPRVVFWTNCIVVLMTVVLGTSMAPGIYAAQIAHHETVLFALLISLSGYAVAALLCILYAMLVLAFVYGPVRAAIQVGRAIKEGFFPACRKMKEGMGKLGKSASAGWVQVAAVPGKVRAMTGRDWFRMIAFAGSFFAYGVVAVMLWDISSWLISALPFTLDWHHHFIFTMMLDILICAPLWSVVALVWIYAVKTVEKSLLGDEVKPPKGDNPEDGQN